MKDDSFKGLAEAINKCAGELPDGYIISLNTENGCTWMEMFRGDKRVWIDNSYPDHSLTERYLMALQRARDLEDGE